MPKKRSEAGAVIAYFSFRPLEEVEVTWGIVAELMRDRRRESRPKVARKIKQAAAKAAAAIDDVKPGRTIGGTE